MPNDTYALKLQRVRVVDSDVIMMRVESGQVLLLMVYLGCPYLEARPENWLVDKKAELKLAYNLKEHATDRPNQSMLYCGTDTTLVSVDGDIGQRGALVHLPYASPKSKTEGTPSATVTNTIPHMWMWQG